jgi:hypothetical protein
MWKAIDDQMSLRDCSIYCYAPEEDPYDEEEGTIWSFDYFFFNKSMKRVCYIYVRGISIMTNSPVPTTPISSKRSAGLDWTSRADSGARKRARYWLGDRAGDVSSGWDDDDDVDEVEHLVVEDGELKLLIDDEEPYIMSADEATNLRNQRSRSMSMNLMRGISEDIAESMEV